MVYFNKMTSLDQYCLGITSDCLHFLTPSGETATQTHIFKRQIEALAAYFDHVIICCPFTVMPAGASCSVYRQSNITFIPSPKVGGDRLKDKIQLLKAIPVWLKLFRQLDRQSHIIYQRFPNNLNIPGFFYFYFRNKPVFATFTGSWDKDPGASFTTRLQRFLLKHIFRGPVWVYTTQLKQKPHIICSFSPSYSQQEWNEESSHIQNRINMIEPPGHGILKMISVGTLCERKNHAYILHTCVLLKRDRIPFRLVIAGTGIRMEEYKQFIAEYGLTDDVELKGSVHYTRLQTLYREADYVVQSPTSEPYGKVPVEGFFHGLIPVLSSSGIFAKYMTDNGKRGFMFDLEDEKALYNLLRYIYYEMPASEKARMITDGRGFVQSLTIDAWAADYAARLSQLYCSN